MMSLVLLDWAATGLYNRLTTRILRKSAKNWRIRLVL